MLIAILSDSHDQILHLNRAVGIANEKRAEVLIHCGDLISPFMLNQLELFTGDVHLIYGNNIGDQHVIASRCSKNGTNLTHHGIVGEITIEDLKIGFHHYPEIARDLAKCGKFDIVCCGHNHCLAVEKINNCLLVNPGDLIGKGVAPGFILLDTDDLNVCHISVGPPVDLAKQFSPECTRLIPRD